MAGLPEFLDPMLLAAAFGALVLFAFMALFMQERSEQQSRGSVKKRLEIDPEPARSASTAKPAAAADPARNRAVTQRAAKLAKKTNEFYASNDPKTLRKMQMQLMQGGFLHENALAWFIMARIGLAVVMGLVGLGLVVAFLANAPATQKIFAIIALALGGYFAPNFYVGRKVKTLQLENRSGFPDVMDLMIVAAEAGLTMEASIERIAQEVEKTYPTLSRQLTIASLEIRAGRPLDQALRAFGERLGLEEVQGFATMIQQSKELGTSVSDALRVYSEEMRHKRMMAAEERAYALPAKLSIPVTAFILPVVVGVAVLPTAVRMSM